MKGRASARPKMRMRSGLWAVALLFLAGCEERWSLQAPPSSQTTTQAKPPPAARTQPKWSASKAGPLKTAMIGGYMDAQEKDFRSRLHGVPVMRVGDDIVVSVRNDLLFKGDALSSRGRDMIKRVAELLRHYDHSAVQVGGYTDTAGPEDRNRALTESHARTVAEALVSDGVARARVSSAGYGSAHLKVATGPDKNEPRNRRIEIRVIAHPEA
jgi:outer membrane protein OmpA-like peptidoglycan-associated protein